MYTFSDAEAAILAPFQSAHDKAGGTLSAAQRKLTVLTAERDEIAAKLAALGGVPDAASFGTASAWSKAKEEREFEAAKLQRHLVSLTDPIATAEDGCCDKSLAVDAAHHETNRAIARILADRVSAAVDHSTTVALDALRARAVLPPEYLIDFPADVVSSQLVGGMLRVSTFRIIGPDRLAA